MSRGWAAAAVALALGLVVFFGWRALYPNDERLIRQRLSALLADVNTGGTGGLGTVARAAQLGSYFTQDVTVDQGEGTAPIVGRETLIGMAARLEPRTQAFRMKFDDVGVTLAPDGSTAEVVLTVSFIQRTAAAGDGSIDAREFAVGMTKDGLWRIGRITAVDTIR